MVDTRGVAGESTRATTLADDPPMASHPNSGNGPVPNVLTIAGSDSGGGAGIQADLKTFSALRVYGCSVLTALTAQNTQGVMSIHPVPAEFVTAQLEAVFDDVEIHAVKVGMLGDAAVVRAVAAFLRQRATAPIVLDPVMVSKGGDRLIDTEALAALQSELLPVATLLTPNLPEAGALTCGGVPENLAQMERVGRVLAERGPAVLVKGGHLGGDKATDVLVEHGRVTHFGGPRMQTHNTHGTGCTLSSAIAAYLARGKDLPAAIAAAKRYVAGAIASADELRVGSGHGPLHHLHELWA